MDERRRRLILTYIYDSEGKSPEEIAVKLEVSAQTIQLYLKEIHVYEDIFKELAIKEFEYEEQIKGEIKVNIKKNYLTFPCTKCGKGLDIRLEDLLSKNKNKNSNVLIVNNLGLFLYLINFMYALVVKKNLKL